MSNKRGFLTPNDLPAEKRAVRVVIPENAQWRSLLVGAIAELAQESSWEQFGAVAVESAVEAANEILSSIEWDMYTVGMIVPFCSQVTGGGWLYCDGSVHNRVDYPELYEAIDPEYIIDDATFKVPDLRARVVMGAGVSDTGTVYPQNVPVGQEAITPSNANMFPHTHTMAHTHAYDGAVGVYGVAASPGELPVLVALSPAPKVTSGVSTPRTGIQGGGYPFSVVQPSLPMRFYVRAKP